MSTETFRYCNVRWACACGRFIAQDNVCARDYRDDGAYYGISTEWHYHCSRCGFREGDPRLVEIGYETVMAPGD